MILVTAAIVFTAIGVGRNTGDEEVGGGPIVFGFPLRTENFTVLEDFCDQWLTANGTLLGQWRAHEAVSVGAEAGTDVLAPYNGTVKFVGQGEFGNTVKIDHGNGLVTKFASLENVVVREGEAINKGNRIATIGMSNGRQFMDTPHVRIELSRDGKTINPNAYIDFGNK